MIHTIIDRSIASPTTSQSAAQQVADAYLQSAVAADLMTTLPILVPNEPPIWRMIVRLNHEGATATVGTIDVDANTGTVTLFTAEQLADMRDRIQAQTGAAKDIVRPLAQIQANGYLTNYVSLFAKADRPVWVPGDPPRWRATVCLHLRGHDHVKQLGTIDVDANTGEVIPLTHQQLHTLRKCVQDAATRSAPTTAATR